MDRNETLLVMSLLKAAYPNYYKNMNRQDAESAVNLWQTMLCDYDVSLVLNAVKAFIATDTKGFPPVVGIIIDKINKITQPQQMTEGEAWELIRKACSNSSYNAEEEFNKLPTALRRIVGSPNMLKEWGLTESDTFQTVIQSNFMRSYRVEAQTEKEYAALPESVKEFTKQITGGVKILEGNKCFG